LLSEDLGLLARPATRVTFRSRRRVHRWTARLAWLVRGDQAFGGRRDAVRARAVAFDEKLRRGIFARALLDKAKTQEGRGG
jgi:hypothetical protein